VRVIEIANSKMMNERSNATLPILTLGTTFRMAFRGGSVSVKTVSDSNRSGPVGRQSLAKILTYSKINRTIKISTYRFKSDDTSDAMDDTISKI